MLVSDWLVAHGHEVLHIDNEKPAKPHKLMAEARMEGGDDRNRPEAQRAELVGLLWRVRDEEVGVPKRRARQPRSRRHPPRSQI